MQNLCADQCWHSLFTTTALYFYCLLFLLFIPQMPESLSMPDGNSHIFRRGEVLHQRNYFFTFRVLSSTFYVLSSTFNVLSSYSFPVPAVLLPLFCYRSSVTVPSFLTSSRVFLISRGGFHGNVRRC